MHLVNVQLFGPSATAVLSRSHILVSGLRVLAQDLEQLFSRPGNEVRDVLLWPAAFEAVLVGAVFGIEDEQLRLAVVSDSVRPHRRGLHVFERDSGLEV